MERQGEGGREGGREDCESVWEESGEREENRKNESSPLRGRKRSSINISRCCGFATTFPMALFQFLTCLKYLISFCFIFRLVPFMGGKPHALYIFPFLLLPSFSSSPFTLNPLTTEAYISQETRG